MNGFALPALRLRSLLPSHLQRGPVTCGKHSSHCILMTGGGDGGWNLSLLRVGDGVAFKPMLIAHFANLSGRSANCASSQAPVSPCNAYKKTDGPTYRSSREDP